MKLIYGTDFHGRMDFYDKLLEQAIERNIDHIIIGADILPKKAASLNEFYKNQKEFLDNLIVYFKDYKEKNPGKEIYTMLGNDDLGILNKEMVKADENKIIKLVSNFRYNINGFFIVGYNFVPPTPFKLKDWEKYDLYDMSKMYLPNVVSIYNPFYYTRTVPPQKTTIAEDLENLVKLSDPKKTIYVFHSPPKSKYLDVTMRGEHVGSEAITQFIKKYQPLLTLHGHIHESYEKTGMYKEEIGNTLCIQPGSNEYKKDGKLNFVIVDIQEKNIETNLYQI